ncbi:glycolate oxidase subunit GlcF [Phaeovulum vinaykumarii]|uniref:Glycolate oxidase iron-sulfur subunit n=1 Tax=Phaeovulum vinaykumarii TaxID=407234 RepID=A0A1N7KRY0_9RHOB|nr:glycolate oxidase subunit GlcF [Phaeovulum vinaykumarii]SIS64307.1 glycolate oxidase iron-sulfur subunit [Phaeovulum vinaykumarii]SOC01617.1 glycolate oxidase iron-sulfur subunit [Phaeovulum vinaykumarii]
MQTTFTPEQLADPAIAQANRILRACVHCGFCTATCPSYQVLGDELDSPRGRIYLIKEMLESGRPADARIVRHLDRCLGCLACMTTCPSGVDYMHLLDHARAHAEATFRRPWHDRLMRAVLARVLTHPALMRGALRVARVVRPLGAWLPDARLRAMLDLAPAHLPAAQPVTEPDPPAPKLRVALLPGCAQKVMDPGIHASATRLLRRLGAEVVEPARFGCCGALEHHMGRTDGAMARARATLAAIRDLGPLDAIVVTTSGCGTTLKDYGHLFAGTPEAEAAAEIAARSRDITEVLEGLDFPECPDRGLVVAYHAACSLQHGQKVTAAPKALLKRAGFALRDPVDPHLCCGSAGTYNVLQPAIAGELGQRKRASLTATGADLIAAGNIGCMVQIGKDCALPVVHTVELLDWATGGPRPAALG